ncbi:MAG: uncharacterized membrane protein YgdD (TMEM256/DUF423 family) [Arenicella sp.]|jgi:uncharacterized membrane protein YgdD (TMEM256/DUF423 family)
MPKINYYFISTFSLTLCIAIGAFGAHGIKNIISVASQATYLTGVRYQFYMSLGLLLLAVVQDVKNIDLSKYMFAIVTGTLLFSFNCYILALTGFKILGMVIPIGGSILVVSWFMVSLKLLR